jgi:hypothetical protein
MIESKPVEARAKTYAAIRVAQPVGISVGH